MTAICMVEVRWYAAEAEQSQLLVAILMSENTRFSHLTDEGRASMVDVSEKPVTRRQAQASCFVEMRADVISRLAQMPKGDAFAVAKIAGISAAKRTDQWIPLAHPLPLDHVDVTFEATESGVLVRSLIVCVARTGAEMEALVACSAAALTLYDMVKAVQKDVVIGELQLDHKSGGRSGDYSRSVASKLGDGSAGDSE